MDKKLTIATTNETENPFNLKNLQQLADSAVDCPVLINFDRTKIIGKVIKANVVDDKLVAMVNIREEYMHSIRKAFAVPGFTTKSYPVRKEGNVIQLFSVGITPNPTDKTLPEID